MNLQHELITDLNKELAMQLPAGTAIEDVKANLYAFINYLITNDFEKLVFVLYRIDVAENKIKALLEFGTETDAGVLIGDAIIERQMEKIRSRRTFKRRDEDIDETERW